MKHLLKLVEEILIGRVKSGAFYPKGKKEEKGGKREGRKKESEGDNKEADGEEEGGIREAGGRRGGKVLMNKARIFQLIEIVRRIKTEEMVRFKFLRNFGVEGESVEKMKRAVLEEEDEARRIIEELGEDEVWVVRLYLELCTNFLSGEKIHKGSKQRIVVFHKVFFLITVVFISFGYFIYFFCLKFELIFFFFY